MKKKKMHPVLVVLLMVLFASCASSDSLCEAYACTTIEEDHVEGDTNQSYDLVPIESKGLEEKPKGFQWEDNLIGPNGGKLY